MKKSHFLIVFAVVLSTSLIGCGGSKNDSNKDSNDSTKQELTTAQNLKDAINGESTASAKYAAFSKKAKEEGFLAVAKLFEATSKSEEIHANNHKKVLEGMGITYEVKIDSFEVKSTLENLQAALEGETYEVQTMYPNFIKQGEIDKADKALQSFNFAMDTEKKHMQLYQAAIDAIKANKEKSYPSEYYVCPKCGYTYNKSDVKENCELCGTSRDKYFVIK